MELLRTMLIQIVTRFFRFQFHLSLSGGPVFHLLVMAIGGDPLVNLNFRELIVIGLEPILVKVEMF